MEENKSKILVIDDEVNIRDLFKEILETEGFSVLVARDGYEGLEINEKENPDVIILDLKLPKMSGIETLQNIRRNDKTVIVVILTGYGTAESTYEAWGLNVYEYIGKPFKNDVVVNVVKEALSMKKNSRKG